MSRTNKEVVLGFIEEVINQKRLDRFNEYFALESVFHSGSYVGLGINGDDTSGEKIVLNEIAPGGPADGKLRLGDELVQVQDELRTWDTFDEIRASVWAWGVIGSPLTVRVRRDDQIVDVQLRRGILQGWAVPINKELFQQFLLVDWPDLKQTVECILEEGDQVMVYLTNMGTHSQYRRQAVWCEFDLYRLRDGKIVEAWGVEDGLRQLKQLGYRIDLPTA
jgi:predicted SnoaL-like aldol condensation-catalyzing enzyme